MIEVELKELLEKFKADLCDSLLKHELYGIEDFDSLKETIEVIITSLEGREALAISLESHPIDKFGLASLATDMINGGIDNKSIAKTLSAKSGIGISSKEVKTWQDTYSHLSYETMKQEKKGNIFDVQTRLQDLYSMLYDHLEAIKEADPEDFWKAKTSKQQVILDAMKELRMLSGEATKVIGMISHQERLRQFTDIVMETIKETDQATAQIIFSKLKKNKALMNVLTPPSS